MGHLDKSLPVFHHKCLKCGREWDSNLEHPKQCTDCRSNRWDRPYVNGKPLASHFIEDLLQAPIDHSEPKNLPFIGARCPYCKGTTGFDTFRVVAFCFSCDATFSVTSGEFLGVLQGIGLR